jgi:7,8-dihydro-6-hydroxymethylpterin dimethyltransferase
VSVVRQQQDRSFINSTSSVCPTCYAVIPAQIFGRDNQVFMRKFCRQHGHVEVLIAGDEQWYRDTIALKYKPEYPYQFTAKVEKGCPSDCGVCGDHQQRCMIPVIEITDHCNMECPICFAHNQNSYNMSIAELDVCLDTIQKSEKSDVDMLVMSGGEPTGHPKFFELMERVMQRGFKHVTINTNGIRIAQDKAFVKKARDLGLEFTLWIDGFRESTHILLRGMDTRLLKQQALAHLGEYDVNTNILCVVARGVNEDEVGAVLDLGMSLPFVRGVTYHTLVYTGKGGKHFPRDSRTVVTTPDIMRLLDEQTGGRIGMRDFSPIPAPHPLCETNTYVLMPEEGAPIPLTRVVPKDKYFELVVNQAILRPDDRLEQRLQEIIDHLYAKADPTDETTRALATFRSLLKRAFPLEGGVTAAEREKMCEKMIKAVFLIPYMDEYNLDLTRLRSCVSMQATPDGKLIPNCAYYPLHRLNDPRFFGRGKLPMFTQAATQGRCK